MEKGVACHRGKRASNARTRMRALAHTRAPSASAEALHAARDDARAAHAGMGDGCLGLIHAAEGVLLEKRLHHPVLSARYVGVSEG